MKCIEDLFYHRYLPKLVARKCDYGVRGIPRDSRDAVNVNCFSIAVYNEGIPYLMLREMRGEEVIVWEWDGDRHEFISETEKAVPLGYVREFEIKIRHYYGLSDVLYTGPVDYVLDGVTGFTYIRLFFKRLFFGTSNLIFRMRKLSPKTRIKLLKMMLKEQQKRTGLWQKEGLSVGEVLTLIYTSKWAIRLDADEQMVSMRLHLESFVDSGDLSKNDAEYVVTGRAIATIENHHNDKRRERRKFILAGLMLLAAIVAAVPAVPKIIELWK